MKQIVLLMSFIFCNTLAFAGQSAYDTAQTAIVKSEIRLNAQGQQWFIFHNDSAQTIWLNAVIKNPSASAGWSSKIDPKKYSLLALSDKDLQFTCGELNQQKFSVVACDKYLHIAQILSTAQEKSVVGSYWVVENASLDSLRQKVASKDMILNFQ